MAKKTKTERTKIKDLPVPATQVTAEEASKVRGGGKSISGVDISLKKKVPKPSHTGPDTD